MTIVNVLSKVIFTLLIFIFIKQSDDYIYITLLNSAGFVVAGIISFILAKVLDKALGGIRVEDYEEIGGLDANLHKESAYNLN